MIRNYDAQSSIDIPRFNSAAALTVSSSIIAAARAEKKLADNVGTALKQVVAVHEVLQGAVFSASQEEPTGSFTEESRAEASAWSAAYGWVTACARLKNKKKAELAAKIIEQIFSDGMTFVRLPLAERWTATDRKLAVVKEHRLDADFAALGGAEFLADIVQSHKALGDAAGITAAPGVQLKSGVQLAFDRWKAATRCYVAQVVANQALAVQLDPSDTAATPLANRLLHALATAEATPSAKAEKGSGAGESKPSGEKAKAQAGSPGPAAAN